MRLFIDYNCITWFESILTPLFSVLHFYNPSKQYKDNPNCKNLTLETNEFKDQRCVYMYFFLLFLFFLKNCRRYSNSGKFADDN